MLSENTPNVEGKLLLQLKTTPVLAHNLTSSVEKDFSRKSKNKMYT